MQPHNDFRLMQEQCDPTNRNVHCIHAEAIKVFLIYLPKQKFGPQEPYQKSEIVVLGVNPSKGSQDPYLGLMRVGVMLG